jgi:sugar phosphate isomerase/epimerase
VTTRSLAVSNLAWMGSSDDTYLGLLADEQVDAVEVAPSLVFAGDPAQVPASERTRYRRRVRSAGLEVTGLQSLYFARPEVQLLATGSERQAFIDYSRRIADLCADLGGSSLVIGAPNQRRRGELPEREAMRRAADTLHELGEHAAQRQTYFTIEALPKSMGADFIHTLEEAAQLVADADSPGIRPHVDTGTTEARYGLPWTPSELGHVHVSDALAPVRRTSRQQRWANLLDGYDGVVSIEMKASDKDNERVLRAAIRDVRAMFLCS